MITIRNNTAENPRSKAEVNIPVISNSEPVKPKKKPFNREEQRNRTREDNSRIFNRRWGTPKKKRDELAALYPEEIFLHLIPLGTIQLETIVPLRRIILI